MDNKVLLYSTENHIQHPITNHNGKEYQKRTICVTESLCRTEEINTNNYTSIKKKQNKTRGCTFDEWQRSQKILSSTEKVTSEDRKLADTTLTK